MLIKPRAVTTKPKSTDACSERMSRTNQFPNWSKLAATRTTGNDVGVFQIDNAFNQNSPAKVTASNGTSQFGTLRLPKLRLPFQPFIVKVNSKPWRGLPPTKGSSSSAFPRNWPHDVKEAARIRIVAIETPMANLVLASLLISLHCGILQRAAPVWGRKAAA